MLKKILVKEVIAPIGIIFFSFIFYEISSRIVKRIFRIKSKRIHEKRQKTFVGLINNVIKYFIVLIALMMILEVYGIDTKSLVASVGVASLVAGLALQDILKDIIAGFSIILEDQYSVGDIVAINGFTGTVQSLGLKTTKLKSLTGEVRMISNRNISEVTNYSISDNVSFIDVSISYDNDVEEVKAFLANLCENLSKELHLKKQAQCLGVEKLADSSVNFRISVTSSYLDKFALLRRFKERIKEECEKQGIVIAYPQLVVHHE